MRLREIDAEPETAAPRQFAEKSLRCHSERIEEFLCEETRKEGFFVASLLTMK